MKLPTWQGESTFEYTGSVEKGTVITYGKGNRETITREQYAKLLNELHKMALPTKTIHSGPIEGSLGKWLKDNRVGKRAIATYVAAILVHEKFAKRPDEIIITKKMPKPKPT